MHKHPLTAVDLRINMLGNLADMANTIIAVRTIDARSMQCLNDRYCMNIAVNARITCKSYFNGASTGPLLAPLYEAEHAA